MKKSRHIFLLTLFISINFLLPAQKSLVSVKNGQFILNSEKYNYIGANYWYGGLLATQGKSGEQRLKKELDFLQLKGVNNLRIAVGAEGVSDYPYRIPGNKTLQP